MVSLRQKSKDAEMKICQSNSDSLFDFTSKTLSQSIYTTNLSGAIHERENYLTQRQNLQETQIDKRKGEFPDLTKKQDKKNEALRNFIKGKIQKNSSFEPIRTTGDK